MGFEWFEAQIEDHYLHYYGGSMSRSFWFWFILFGSCPSDLPDTPSSLKRTIIFVDGDQITYSEEATHQSDWSPICTNWGEPVEY